MTVADLHLRAFVPLRWTLCGVPLLQLRVGHVRLLEAMELWRPRSREEFILCAFLLSRLPSEFCRTWQTKSARRWLSWRMLRTAFRWDWASTRRVWDEFVEFNLDEPMVIFDKKSRDLKGPWLSHMRVALCEGLGYAPETFDDQPYAQAVLDYYSLAEQRDAVKLQPVTVSQMESLRSN